MIAHPVLDVGEVGEIKEQWNSHIVLDEVEVIKERWDAHPVPDVGEVEDQ